MIPFALLLGTHPSNHENYFDTVLSVAQASEAAGMDAVFYSDHFQYQRKPHIAADALRLGSAIRKYGPSSWIASHLEGWAIQVARMGDSGPHHTMTVLECFTTLAAIASQTQKIRLGALVAGVPYRNPALLAKINITLDIISHGRCIAGLGAGWYEEEFKAYGWPFPNAKERMDRLEEAVQIVSVMLSQPQTSFEGKHYQIQGAVSNPLPVQRPRPPILVGGSGEQRTLQIVAKYADYCNIFGSPKTVARKLDVLQRHCEAVGRPYHTIVPSNFVSILIAQSQAELNRKRKRYHPWLGYTISGTPEKVIEILQAFVQAGIRYVIFNLPDAHTLDPIYLLAESVMPVFFK